MIQKSNIKFSDRDTRSFKYASPNSHFFPAEINPKNMDSRFGQTGQLGAVPENGP